MIRRTTAITAAFISIVLLGATGASAATGTGKFSSSCNTDYGYTSNNTYYVKANKGTMTLQNLSDRTVVQRLVSSNGNAVSASTKASGKSSSWSNVLAGKYRVQAKISADTNCNGWLPGKGNFNYSYKITY